MPGGSAVDPTRTILVTNTIPKPVRPGRTMVDAETYDAVAAAIEKMVVDLNHFYSTPLYHISTTEPPEQQVKPGNKKDLND